MREEVIGLSDTRKLLNLITFFEDIKILEKLLTYTNKSAIINLCQ